MRVKLLILVIVLVGKISYSQVTDFRGSSFSAGASYFELKDELNHGLVFRGPDVMVYYGYNSIDSKRYFSYQVSLGGGGKTTKGTWGFTWYFSPVDVHYSWRIGNNSANRLYLGPSLKAQYFVQNYPDLHAGPINWFTSYDLGIHMSAFFVVKDMLFELKYRNNVLSLNSRPLIERDPYYFSTAIGDNLSDFHSNMTTNTVNRYNQSELTATLFLEGAKRVQSISYQFNFTGFFTPPSFIQIFNQFRYTLYFNSKQ